MSSGKLQNSLMEILVVVGMDQHTGLVPDYVPGQSSEVLPGPTPLFTTAFESQVLAACAHEVANFPNSSSIFDSMASFSTSTWSSNIPPSPARGVSSTIPPKGGKTRRSQSLRRLTPTGKHSVALPVGSDVISSLPPLCLPGNAYVYKDRPKDHVHYLVLTDISGAHSYATVYTCYRKFLATQVRGKSEYSIRAVPLNDEGEEGTKICYVPLCCCMVSRAPYFFTMRDCLTCLVQQLHKDVRTMEMVVADFSSNLALVPRPPPGHLAISFQLNKFTVTVPPALDPDQRVLDMPLHYPFLSFSLDNILTLVACILTEQRIVFLASDYALLTIVMESFLTYLQPFVWHNVYVPVLSSSMVDLVEAPGVFMMGCHVSHREKIIKVPGIVVADIQSGEVFMADSVLDNAGLPCFPRAAAEFFKEKCGTMKFQYDFSYLHSPTPTSVEEARKHRETWQHQLSRNIQITFLQTMVRLFRDVKEYVSTVNQRRYLNKDKFLEDKEEGDKPFFKEVCQSHMFKRFLKDRMDQKRDFYSIMEETMQWQGEQMTDNPDNKLIRRRKISATSPGQKNRRSGVVNFGLEVNGPNSTFQLPSFTQSHRMTDKTTAAYFYDSCIQKLTNYLESCEPSDRAPYLYLRGMVYAAKGASMTALEDFHNLCSADVKLFPAEHVQSIINSLSEVERSQLEQKGLYKGGPMERKTMLGKLRRMSTEVDRGQGLIIALDFDQLPQRDVDLHEFSKHIRLLDIAVDSEVIERLFQSLTLQDTNYLDPDTFSIFYDCWKETELDNSRVACQLPEDCLTREEGVLKVSRLIRCDLGTGRLILTHKRLLFRTGDRTEEVVRIRDIKNLEKFQYNTVLTSADALKIYSKVDDQSPFTAILKEERNQWFMLVQELWCGRNIAEGTKDSQVVHQAAQNVLLINAVVLSGDYEECAHFDGVEKAAENLCYFTKRRKEGKDKLPQETTEVLIQRVNPSQDETVRNTVEALLYTSGDNSKGDNRSSPQLWCAMGSGQVKVYDASTWICDQQFIQANNRVCCLLSVGTEQVWAGSFDTTIYVIDINTHTANKQLLDHVDMVSDLTISQDGSTVYSASLNGQILLWSAATLQKRGQIWLKNVQRLVSIKLVGQNLWCCTKSALLLVDREGQTLHTLQMTDEGDSPLQIECFLLSQDGMLWAGSGNQGRLTVWDLAGRRLKMNCCVTAVGRQWEPGQTDSVGLSREKVKDELLCYIQLWAGSGNQGRLTVWDSQSYRVVKNISVSCRGLSKMVQTHGKIWVGGKCGNIHIFNQGTYTEEKELVAHEDAIRSMCAAFDRYIMTGSGSKDGKIAIWRV
ncbi:PREDICTED: DENN domain-containing protein 3-like [Branchiostoma belcheri]|uniref:DENN domain-containing protein 3-like n=1 Tax=Branchiostoma belcheri TaxID=7741 RepID=A0A6P4Y0B6_BRABE|nr:PREDICTED: DENN domain-containing protein 3-like [Branchiostoma belcheri]